MGSTRVAFVLLPVGGARPRGGGHPSAIARLQGFSSCSPAASPHQWSSRMMTTSSVVGRSKPGCGLCPALSFKDLHHPCWGGGWGKSGPASAWADDPLLPPAFGGERHPPALRRRRPPAIRGKANCCCLDRVQLSVLHPRRRLCCVRAGHVQVLPAPSAAQHVVCHEGGTRVLGWSRSHSRSENGSEDLSVRFGAAATRWCSVGGQVAAVVGAEVVVTIGEAASAEAVTSADDTVSATYAPGLRLFGFNGWFSSPVRGCERGPSSGSVCPGAIAAVVLPSETEVVVALLVQRSPASHPEFVVPQALSCGGCSYPREWNRSPVCNGTLNMGVCSLWLSRPERLGI
jgi:hypothetical protein